MLNPSRFENLKNTNPKLQNNSCIRLESLYKYIFFAFLTILSTNTLAQKINAKYELHIKPASSEIKIDGDVSEQAWNDAELVTNFFMVQPMDTSFAKIKTDTQPLHVIVHCGYCIHQVT